VSSLSSSLLWCTIRSIRSICFLWFPKIPLIFKEYARTDRNEVLSSND